MDCGGQCNRRFSTASSLPVQYEISEPSSKRLRTGATSFTNVNPTSLATIKEATLSDSDVPNQQNVGLGLLDLHSSFELMNQESSNSGGMSVRSSTSCCSGTECGQATGKVEAPTPSEASTTDCRDRTMGIATVPDFDSFHPVSAGNGTGSSAFDRKFFGF